MPVPPKTVRTEAERGLAWRREFNRGGTLVGVARARDIANGKDLSAQTISRMVSYFARHEVDKQGQGWSPGEDGYPSAGRIAWALWGGDPGRAWADSQNRRSAPMSGDTRDVISIGTPDHVLDVTATDEGVNADLLDVDEPARYSKRQLELAHEIGEIVAECGQFDQSWGSNGAYYVEGRDNPWQAKGLNCANCVSYEGPRACEWVAGVIDPDGLCKLSVIPADLVTDAPLASTASTAIPNGPTTSDEMEAEMPRARQTPIEARKSHGRDVEFRQVTMPVHLEERAVDAPADEPVRFSGYAAVFNSPSERLYDRANGEFTEVIAPGAFKRTLARDNDVRMYLNHNSDMVLASTRSGTLSLAEDERGLKVDAELPNTSYAQDLANLMRSGVVDSMSFGFQVPANGDSWDDDTRTLNEIALHEVSVVTGFPAYPETAGASVRSQEQPADEDSLPLSLAQAFHQLYSRTRD